MKDKKFLFWTSALTLLPMLAGLLLWDRLPSEMPTHWGASGQLNGWSSRAFTVFGLPGIMLLLHWLMVGGMYLDRRNIGHNKKIMRILLMIFPALSNTMAAAVYAIALGRDIRITTVTMALMGLMFIGMGNYLPKCRQNATLGIKLKWTLYNEENWNKTHRLGGKVFVAGGLAVLCLAFVPEDAFISVFLPVLLAMILIPTAYSYALYKKQVKAGTWTQSAGSIAAQPQSRTMRIVSIAVIAAVVVLALAVCFTGTIEYDFGGDALTVEASFWEDITVPYADIDAVEFRADGVEGSREMGYGSPKLLLGTFRNDEFGYYTRYTCTGDAACVVLRSGDKVLVLGAEDDAATRELYEQLLARVG